MMIFYGLGIGESFARRWRGQIWGLRIWALQRLIAVDFASGDIRWAMVTLVLRGFTAIWRFGQARLIGSGRSLARRLGRAAGLASVLSAADSMVAAGGS